MKVTTGHGHMIVNFDEGRLKGSTVKFHGEPCADNMLGIYGWSGEIIEPTKRKLTLEEFEYVKEAVLKYYETSTSKRKIQFGSYEMKR